MRLVELQLNHFRNYEELFLEFGKGVHIFIGENAQGKTNLMESIYTLAMTKSHRTNQDRELIMWNEDTATIKGKVEKKISNIPLEIRFSNKGKIGRVNHLEQKKLSSYLGQLNVILFAPENLELVKGAPANRRKFMDMELGQMNPIYLHELVEYQRLIKQRNHYLKQLAIKKSTADIYLEVLTEKGISQDDVKELYQKQFEAVQKRELEQANTLVGPHRDDLIFYLNDKPVQNFGSQGQQRSTVLSLKLAEIELMNIATGEYPILLLDDVLSELDDDRQTHLIKAIENKVQTFITTTSLDGIRKQFINEPIVYPIHQGQVQ